jgi:hypothetical protein
MYVVQHDEVKFCVGGSGLAMIISHLYNKAMNGMVRYGLVWFGMVRLGEARQGPSRHDITKHSEMV